MFLVLLPMFPRPRCCLYSHEPNQGNHPPRSQPNTQRKEKNTFFSISLTVSSDAVLFAFFTWFMASPRTFRKASLALFVSCLASLASVITITYFGTGTRIIIPSSSGFRFILLSLIALIAAAVLCKPDQKVKGIRDFCEICPSWFNGNFPSFVVRILRFLPKSSLRTSITDCISSFNSFRLIMSSTKAALIFTLAWVCPLPLSLLSLPLVFLVARCLLSIV
uniref:Uncharacterized protein n=1 Tax=Pelusios castaneus TaxID=367368 RepID=A0A8C8VGB5_9SAUR